MIGRQPAAWSRHAVTPACSSNSSRAFGCPLNATAIRAIYRRSKCEIKHAIAKPRRLSQEMRRAIHVIRCASLQNCYEHALQWRLEGNNLAFTSADIPFAELPSGRERSRTHRKARAQRIGAHGTAISKNSSATECAEDAFIRLRCVSIVGESRLILIRSREHGQHPGKRREVAIFDRGVERSLYSMIARDEGWIGCSHHLSARAGFKRLCGQTRSPCRGPTVVGRGIREQDPHIRIRFLVGGRVAQPTES